MERVLFSTIGDTDPVRNCYDGACLHIARHYQPRHVVLFYTADMGAKAKKDQRYVRAIRRVLPEATIEEIFSGVEEPQHYDAFQHNLPEAVGAVLAAYPQAEILLNLSSGTPQMKTVMAILAADLPRCLGVQVDSPVHGSNRRTAATQDDEDIEALLENNFDDEPDAVNRCSEPPLRVFRYYADKQKVLSLVQVYEYTAALHLARQVPEMPPVVMQLIGHAEARSNLQPERAKKLLARYGGKELFPLAGREQELVEKGVSKWFKGKSEVSARRQRAGARRVFSAHAAGFPHGTLCQYASACHSLPVRIYACLRAEKCKAAASKDLSKEKRQFLSDAGGAARTGNRLPDLSG